MKRILVNLFGCSLIVGGLSLLIVVIIMPQPDLLWCYVAGTILILAGVGVFYAPDRAWYWLSGDEVISDRTASPERRKRARLLKRLVVSLCGCGNVLVGVAVLYFTISKPIPGSIWNWGFITVSVITILTGIVMCVAPAELFEHWWRGGNDFTDRSASPQRSHQIRRAQRIMAILAGCGFIVMGSWSIIDTLNGNTGGWMPPWAEVAFSATFVVIGIAMCFAPPDRVWRYLNDRGSIADLWPFPRHAYDVEEERQKMRARLEKERQKRAKAAGNTSEMRDSSI